MKVIEACSVIGSLRIRKEKDVEARSMKNRNGVLILE